MSALPLVFNVRDQVAAAWREFVAKAGEIGSVDNEGVVVYTEAEWRVLIDRDVPPGWELHGRDLHRRDARGSPVVGDVWDLPGGRVNGRCPQGLTSRRVYGGEVCHPDGRTRGPFLTDERWYFDGRPTMTFSRNRLMSLPPRAALIRPGVGSEDLARLCDLSKGALWQAIERSIALASSA